MACTTSDTATDVLPEGVSAGLVIAALVIPLLGLIIGVMNHSSRDPLRRRSARIAFWLGIASVVLWAAVYLAGASTGDAGYAVLTGLGV